MRTDLKLLKRTGLCEVFLVFHRRAAVTIGPPIQTVKGKLLSNLMRRVPMAPPKKNQTNQQQQASEANRRLQFNKEIEVPTLFKGNQQRKSQQKTCNSSATSREEFQSTADRYDKKF